MVNDGGDGAVKSTTDVRQGSRHRANLHVLIIALTILAITGVLLYLYFIDQTPVPLTPGTGAPPH